MKTTDTRDQRDPQALGEALLATPGKGKASHRYDKHHIAMLAVPDYDDEGKGICAEQVAKYAAEFPEGLPSVDDVDPGGA